MLRVLLAKDLRRAWRNPLPWLLNLVVPLAMTALIGMVFGGGSGSSAALGRIRFAVVDEDQSVLSQLLRGAAANQEQGSQYLEPVFLDRDEALRRILDNKISAVLIVPTNFTRDYFTGHDAVSLELIKNPAQSVHPAVLEELLGAVVTGLNAVSRNFNSEFPQWQAVFEGKRDYHQVARLVERAGAKLNAAKSFLNPPLVTYTTDTNAHATPAAEASAGISRGAPALPAAPRSGRNTRAAGGMTGIFAYVLIGLTAMFLLFLAQHAMTDLHRELRLRTFERYQTLRERLAPFIAGKVVFAVVVLLLCSSIMLGGGGLAFRIRWQQPVALTALVLGYAAFAAALFAVLVALVPDERRAAVLNNIAALALALVGGCAFPPDQFPAFLREHIMPWLPTNWFVTSARALQFNGTAEWGFVLLKLSVCAVLLTLVAAMLFRRKFKAGLPA